MPAVELRNLAKLYGRKMVLHDLNLTVEAGEFMVVFGLPVSGKSVLVRLLTGLEAPDAGQVVMRGADATRLAAGERNIGYVPQSFALYPHFTVRQNISYPLDLARVPRAEVEPEVHRVAGLLGIEPLLDRRPDQLSGGQKQRVAIARGLVKRTDIYVLDDPLVGLDFKLRERLIDDLKRTQELLKVTFVYMTSDAVESMMLASRIAVLAGGAIVECGTPEDLYVHPAQSQTMRYVGFPQSNFLEGRLGANGAGAVAETALFNLPLELEAGADPHAGAIEVGIRPEHIRLCADQAPGMAALQAKVLLREDLGGEEIVYLDAGGVLLTTVLRSEEQQQQAQIDQVVTIGVLPADVVAFAGGRRIGQGRSNR